MEPKMQKPSVLLQPHLRKGGEDKSDDQKMENEPFINHR